MTTHGAGVDPHRLAIAAHELGHAIVWRAVGFDIDEIWIKGHGLATHGHVWIVQTEEQIRTTADEHAVQTGLLAGLEAQLRWCHAHSLPTATVRADTDMTLYHQRRRTRLGRDVDPAAVRDDTRRLLHQHWNTLTRLVPVLATAGRLSPRRLPRITPTARQPAR